jgi:hypothetical protein
MPKPTLAEVFGANATQNATTLTLSKSDLASVGLTTSATNSAESLLAAIILKSKEYLSQTNFDLNIDQSTVVGTGFKSTTVRGTNNTQYLTDQLTLTLAKIDPLSPLDPDDY